MIGTFFNQTLPSTIGGDAVRLWLVTRTGASCRFATYSVLVDRVSMPWSFELIRDDHGRAALVLVDVAAMSAGLAFLVVGRLRWRWLDVMPEDEGCSAPNVSPIPQPMSSTRAPGGIRKRK